MDVADVKALMEKAKAEERRAIELKAKLGSAKEQLANEAEALEERFGLKPAEVPAELERLEKELLSMAKEAGFAVPEPGTGDDIDAILRNS